MILKDIKCVLLGTNRCGSTCLRLALDSHSELSLTDEIFMASANGKDYMDLERKKLMRDFYTYNETQNFMPTSDAIPLVNLVFNKYNGFKVHVNAGHLTHKNPVWGYLASIPNIHIIHLRRRNKIRQIISLLVSATNNVWHTEIGKPKKRIRPIRIKPADVIKWADSYEVLERRYEALFANCKSTKLVYEDIKDDMGGAVTYLQGFLGVSKEQPKISHEKFTTEPLNKLIVNYKQLRKEVMSNSKWSWALDD